MGGDNEKLETTELVWEFGRLLEIMQYQVCGQIESKCIPMYFVVWITVTFK